MRELKEEVNNNERYNLKFVFSIDTNEMESIDFKEEVLDRVYSENISGIVIDLKDQGIGPVLPRLYNLIFHRSNSLIFTKFTRRFLTVCHCRLSATTGFWKTSLSPLTSLMIF